jgi:allophanate hydrolase subunit 2
LPPASSTSPAAFTPAPPGNIQVPADGRPIIIAQAKPDDRVQFVRLDLEEAHTVLRKWNRFLEETEQGLMDS